ncbi:MAG: GtrA family protein [Parasphingopyxis sp.]|nr:GtrA family protein [Sphingomonadales bacterium]
MPIVKRGALGRQAVLAGQLARYGAVGLGVTLLGAGVYWVTATIFGVAPLIANLIAYVAMVTIGYALHSRFSFRGHGVRDSRTGGRFLIASWASLGLNSLWVWIATGVFEGADWWPIPAMILVTPLAIFWLNRKWVFS